MKKPREKGATYMNYNDYKEKAYDLLTDYIAPQRDQFDILESERVTKKEQLNSVLGLNEENNYRLIVDSALTEAQFKACFPRTVKFIEGIIGEGTRYKATSNRVYTGERTFKKLTKVLNQHILSTGPTDEFVFSCNELNIEGNVQCYLSSLMDMMKPKRIVISTNIYDMLTSSTNASFSSCYNIDGGEYFNGNLAYIRDSFTAITFVYADDIHRKVGRNWVYVLTDKFKILMPGKPYGSMYKSENKIIRNHIQKAVSKFKGVRPYWKMKHNIGFTGNNYENGRGAVYVDDAYMGMSYHKRQTDDVVPYIEFELARCLKCGDETHNGEGGICNDCETGNRCTYCGDSIDDAYFTTPDGAHACEYCFNEEFIICYDCGTTTPNADSYYIDGIDGYICSNCHARNYDRCVDCGNSYHDNDMTDTENGNVCQWCLDNYTECAECGDFILYPVERDGRWICEQCDEKLVENLEKITV